MPVKAWVQDRTCGAGRQLPLVVLMVVPAYALTQSSTRRASRLDSGCLLRGGLAAAAICHRPAGEHQLAVVRRSGGSGLGDRWPDSREILLEKVSGGGTGNPFSSTFEVGLPEELAKMVPVAVVAVLAIHGVHWARNLSRAITCSSVLSAAWSWRS